MLRWLHSRFGLIATLLAVLLALSGAMLSLDPALQRLHTVLPADGPTNVAQLAGRVAAHYPGAEQLQRTPSGRVMVHYSLNGQHKVDWVDPKNGQSLGPYESSPVLRWIKDLHRSLFLDTSGRAVSGLTALAMLMLSVTGAILLVKRAGGWRQLWRAPLGSRGQRWHASVGRLAVIGLLLSALTGVYMSATTFGFVSDGMDNEPDFPAEVSAGPALPVAALPALLAVDVNQLRELVYPKAGDAADVYTLRTDQGDGYVDQASGTLLSFQPHDGARQVYELIYLLHTGEGVWWLGLLLGVSALGVPVMSATGLSMWWQRRQAMPRLANNMGAQSADTVILVGSENNSTWGFAKALHDALTQAGLRVHTAAMNQLAGDYRLAQRLLILTATYGDGDAPGSADQFLAKLVKSKVHSKMSFAVLGFGDRQFPQFCKFAGDVQVALAAQGGRQLLDLHTIDRQSEQDFARWGRALGDVMGQPLSLQHAPKYPPTYAYELLERIDYGKEVQAPTSVLRFKPLVQQDKQGWLARMIDASPRFEAGDLVGIVPPGSTAPRFYSLASGDKDGVLEICVRRQTDGLCSGYLHGLSPGEHMTAFIQPNPNFRPASGKSPIVLVGAGAGIGPLAGFIRNNEARHPMYLYWGGRDPDSDFLYEPELAGYLADKRLTELHAAFSRVKNGGYVQDRIGKDAVQLRHLIEGGAQVLVCGSRAMALSVRETLNEILAPLKLTVHMLKTQGRYREDVY